MHAALDVTCAPAPTILDVLELPDGLEATGNHPKPMTLVEPARAHVSCEREEPKATQGVVLCQLEQRRPEALPDTLDTDMQLGDRLWRVRDESCKHTFKLGHADVADGENAVTKVLGLLADRMRIHDADTVLEARTPKAYELVDVARLEVGDRD